MLCFETKFYGVMVDAEKARVSSSKIVQYEACCYFGGQAQQIDNTKAAVCHFGIGSARSKRVASIIFPTGSIWFSLNVHVVNADTRIYYPLMKWIAWKPTWITWMTKFFTSFSVKRQKMSGPEDIIFCYGMHTTLAC